MTNPALKTLAGYISARGLKSSRLRDIVLDSFLSSEQHVSKEELCQKIRAQHGDIGFSTVYRALKVFVDAGIARELRFENGQTLYEQVFGRSHHHLVCTRCRTIADFDHEGIEKVQGEIANSHGFIIESQKLELYGLCSDCRQ